MRKKIWPVLVLSLFLTFFNQAQTFLPPHTGITNGYLTSGDLFGDAIATDGGWVIMGAPGEGTSRGQALIYSVVYDGSWAENLLYDGSSASNRLGTSVDISGNFAVAGAPGFSGAEGRVRIFHNDPTDDPDQGWQLFDTLPNPDTDDGDLFGYSVAISGDRIVVGAYGSDDVGTNKGKAFVFKLNSAGDEFVFEEDFLLLTSDGEGLFGRSVDIDGTRIVVSAPDWEDDSTPGALFVYDFNGSQWIRSAKLVPTGLANGSGLGESVTLSGGTIAAGLTVLSNTSASGQVYVFALQPSQTWDNEPLTIGSQVNNGDAFGTYGLDIKDGWLAIGAYQTTYVNGSNDQYGAAYIYSRNTQGVWEEAFTTDPNQLNAIDHFGKDIAIGDGILFVGAPRHDGSGFDQSDFGKVHTFLMPDDENYVPCTGVSSLRLCSNDDENNPAELIIENDDVAEVVNDRRMILLKNYGGARIDLENTFQDRTWRIATPNNYERMNFSLVGTGYAEMSIDLSGNLEVLNDITAGGTVTWSSDRNIKENFVPVDHHDILEKVADIEISKWNYIRDEQDTAHIGPMAQDFYAAFGVGANEKTISSTDVNGVAIASIKALNEKVEARDAEIADLKLKLSQVEAHDAEIADLKSKLDQMKRLLEELADK